MGANQSLTDEQPPLHSQSIATAAQCQALCAERGTACVAAEYRHPDPASPGSDGTCALHSGCMERQRAAYPKRVDVMHRWGPTWPTGATPNSVRWRLNATLVVCDT